MATGTIELDEDIFAVVTPNTVWKVDLNHGVVEWEDWNGGYLDSDLSVCFGDWLLIPVIIL